MCRPLREAVLQTRAVFDDPTQDFWVLQVGIADSVSGALRLLEQTGRQASRPGCRTVPTLATRTKPRWWACGPCTQALRQPGAGGAKPKKMARRPEDP